MTSRGKTRSHCPRIDVTLDALNGATWFSTLDLKSGYWQVELEAGAKEKTAFSAGKGLWQFKVMPFGLCNAPVDLRKTHGSSVVRTSLGDVLSLP